MYDVPILLRVRGENVMYFNVKDKGVVTVTGCCHPGILTLNAWARRNIKGYQPYGCYGGLHITLFESWSPKFDDIIKGVKAFKLKKVGCNHCTGWIWAEKALAAGRTGGEGHQQVQNLQKVLHRGQVQQRVSDQRRLGRCSESGALQKAVLGLLPPGSNWRRGLWPDPVHPLL